MQCGSSMKTQNETYLYDRNGIRATLVDIPIHRCAECGEHEIEIPRIAQLNRVLTNALVRKPSRLTGTEIRFLRKSLGWSGADFARHIEVEPATVSRWESGKQDMGPTTERFLRLLVSTGTPIENYTIEDMPTLSGASRDPRTTPIRFQRSHDTWRMVA